MGYYRVAKFMTFILNGILLITGSVFIAAAILLRVDSGLLENEVVAMFDTMEYNGIKLGTLSLALTYSMMSVGAAILLVAVLGICGTLKKYRCCLVINLVVNVVCMVVLAVLIAFWVNLKDKSGDWLRGTMLIKIKDYHGPRETDTVSKGWNALFIYGHCCGVDGGNSYTSDFVSSNWAALVTTEHVPATCCQGVENTYTDITRYINSASCTTVPKNYYTTGCYGMIVDYIRAYSLLVIICSTVTFVVQISAIISTCVMMDLKMNKVGFIGIAVALKKKELNF